MKFQEELFSQKTHSYNYCQLVMYDDAYKQPKIRRHHPQLQPALKGMQWTNMAEVEFQRWISQ